MGAVDPKALETLKDGEAGYDSSPGRWLLAAMEILAPGCLEGEARGAAVHLIDGELYSPILTEEERGSLIDLQEPTEGRTLERYAEVRVARALERALPEVSDTSIRITADRSGKPGALESGLAALLGRIRAVQSPTAARARARAGIVAATTGAVVVLADAPAFVGFASGSKEPRFLGGERRILSRRVLEPEILVLGSDAGDIVVLDFTAGFQLLAAGLRHRLVREAASAVSEGADALVGSLFDDKYIILRCIGIGGFGSVYEARDVEIDHRVAIKILNPEAAANPDDLAAFKAEARRITRLQHPNIVEWKAFHETADGTCYLVMELLEGKELYDLLQREGTLHPRRAAGILLQILDALRAGHRARDDRILHLDLKPKNVFLISHPHGEEGDWVKVIDFGIGQFVGGREVDRSSTPTRGESSRPLGTVRRTVEHGAGAAAEACTPEYAAPEQCANLLGGGQRIVLDPRADVYSVGVLGFQMITGDLPIVCEGSRVELMRRKTEVDSLRTASAGIRVSRRLAAFLDKCLERDRERRWVDAGEAYEALRRIVHPPLAPRLLVGLAAVAVLIGAGLSWLWPDGFASLDVYEVGATSERLVTGDTLFLGPAKPSTRLRLSGIDDGAIVTAVRLLDTDGSGSTAFEAVWIEGGMVDFGIAEPERRVRTGLQLLLEIEGEGTVRSAPIEAVWIANAAIELVDWRVEGLGERALDPARQLLRIIVRGDMEDVAEVLVEAAGERYRAPTERILDDGGLLVHAISLDALDMEAGLNELRIVVRDRALGERIGNAVIDVVSGPLSIAEASLDCLNVGSGFVVPPGRDPELTVRLGRPADLRWRVRSTEGDLLLEGREQGTIDAVIPLEGLAGARGGRAYSGWIDLDAEEAAYVLHADRSNGTASRRVEFVYQAARPEVEAWFESGVEVVHLDPDEAVYSCAGELVLRVARTNDVPVHVEVASGPLRGPEPPELRDRVRLTDPAAPGHAFPLRFEEEGEYRVAVTGRRPRPDGTVSAEEPDLRIEGVVVIDRHPPELLIERLDGAGPILSLGNAPPGCRLSLSDPWESGRSFPTPVTVRWELARREAPDLFLGSGLLPSPVSVTGSAEFPLPLPPLAPAGEMRSSDGAYMVRVTGTDGAGNQALPGRLDYELSLEGPYLEMMKPVRGIAWPQEAPGLFRLDVLAWDPNGTRDVSCSLAPVGGGPGPEEVALEPAGGEGAASIWRGEILLGRPWSGMEVDLELRAEDGLNSERSLTVRRRLSEIERALPPRVAVELASGSVRKMVLIRVAPGAAYTFGGRYDAQEDDLFRAAGLGPYSLQAVVQSWSVVCDPGSIGDYYLDEDEVSVREFLAFVRAENGYRDVTHWPAGTAPEPVRRARLEQSLAEEQPDMPVVDVSWGEAFAYSSWTGRRLPSFVEWEVALRGGTSYRPYASYTPGSTLPPADVNYDPGGLGGGAPFANGVGSDVSPEGIWNLSANVSEWTATPAAPGHAGLPPLSSARHARTQVERYLRPRDFPGAEGMDEYWVVGGSFDHARCDFTVADARPRSWSDRRTGFRCALAGEEMLERILEGRANGPSFRAEYE